MLRGRDGQDRQDGRDRLDGQEAQAGEPITTIV